METDYETAVLIASIIQGMDEPIDFLLQYAEYDSCRNDEYNRIRNKKSAYEF